MSETEATYTVAEPLPECETGSAERMLEAAIAWNTRNCGNTVYGMRPEEVLRLHDMLASQTRLLRNILAKMQQATQPEPCDWLGGWQRMTGCPNCGAAIRVMLEFSKTTHG